MLGSLLIAFVVMVLIRFPIALAIGMASMISIAFFSHLSLLMLVQNLVNGLDNFVFLCIPLFILAGNLMNAGGITDKIFRFARALVGRVRGGLGYANVVSSMLFSGMTGSAVAEAAALGTLEIKAMKDQGYTVEFASALTVASSVIGPVIPPSIPMVLYAALAEVSVGRLFLGGIIPGVLVGVALMVFVRVMAVRKDLPRDARITVRQFLSRTAHAILPGLTPVIILGGIVGGVFTPTEAASVAVIYAVVLSMFVYRTVKVRHLPKILLETMITTTIVTFVISAAKTFSYILVLGNISAFVVHALTAISTNQFVILFVLNAILLFFGCIMEAGVALILLVPILTPFLHTIGINLVHFGVLMTLNLMIGVATPPIGMSLFVVSHVSGLKIETLMKAILPFLIPPVAVLLLITYVPGLVTLIPNLVMGK